MKILKIIKTEEELNLLKDSINSCKYLTLDTETNGLSLHKSLIIGFSFSFNKDEGYYVPIWTWENNCLQSCWDTRTAPEFGTPQEFPPLLFLEDFIAFLSTKKLIMHNAPFDCGVIKTNFSIDLSSALFCDTKALKHFIDENTRNGLKEISTIYKNELDWAAIDPTLEQKELAKSVVKNGGTWNKSNHDVWRGDLDIVGKYAAQDAVLTLRVFEYFNTLLYSDLYEDKHSDLFYKLEIMPLCKEVLIPMAYNGIHIDVHHFEELKKELEFLLEKYNKLVIEDIQQYLSNFKLVKPIEEIVTDKDLVKAIIEKEKLEHPFEIYKGVKKESLSKKAIQRAYEETKHWLWGYHLGIGDELPYSSKEISEIKLQIMRQKLQRLYRFNINSAEHLRWLLFNRLNINQEEYLEKRDYTEKTNKPSTKDEVLEKLKDDYPFLQLILTYRKLNKLYGTYVCPILALQRNNWLYLNFNQTGTVSGRFSCSGGFNAQTLPRNEEISSCPKCDNKELRLSYTSKLTADIECICGHTEKNIICYSQIKAGFIAPKGYKIVSADYASLEPRAFSYMSGDPGLKEIYQKDLDLYSKIYCDILDKKNKYSANPKDSNYLKKVNPQARSLFKPIILGIPYGASNAQVAYLMGLKTTDKKGREFYNYNLAQEYIDQYLDTYPKLREYMLNCEDEACAKGYVETIFGRRRRFTYTPYIYKLLGDRGIDIQDFLKANSKTLDGMKITLSSGTLYEFDLRNFCTHFKKGILTVNEEGNWNYIKNLVRNELNNAKNVKIQGLAAHITNRAMIGVNLLFKKNDIDGYIFQQVHDELSCYVREDQAELAKTLLQNAMEDNYFTRKLDIPMKAEPVICNNLKEAK